MADKKVSQKTVLFVEDDKYLQETATFAMEKAGYHVVSAVEGEDALQQALALHPDLTILDIQIPGKNGMEVLKELRQDPWGKKAKVMVLTNYGETENVADSLQLGVLEFLMKVDWSLESLLKKIKTHLS